MKTLKNHTLLYDVDCPLCDVYTNGFIQCNMLDKNGRKPFIDLRNENYIDIHRAKNEIALVDTKNKVVTYGIDSLLKVIGNSFPIISKIGSLKSINFLLKKIYAFISYNRKVIIPSKKKDRECVPSFNYKYRILYIILSVLITAFTLFNYAELLPNLPFNNIGRELSIALGQIVFQSIFLLKKDKKTIINYIGNLMTVSLIGSLPLMPFLLINTMIQLHQIFYVSVFFLIAFIMFIEHTRRVKILELPNYLSLTWVLYRVVVLFILLNLNI